jgi:hypothetical protein
MMSLTLELEGGGFSLTWTPWINKGGPLVPREILRERNQCPLQKPSLKYLSSNGVKEGMNTCSVLENLQRVQQI